MQKLQTLTLSNNELTTFDASIFFAASALEYLYISQNQLAGFTEELDIVSASPLRVLDLSFNKLHQIPSIILKESKIHNLNLQGNEIKRQQLMKMEVLDEY